MCETHVIYCIIEQERFSLSKGNYVCCKLIFIRSIVILAVERRANDSLSLTSSIRSASEKVITEAEDLSMSLESTNTTSKLAYDAVLQARSQALIHVHVSTSSGFI